MLYGPNTKSLKNWDDSGDISSTSTATIIVYFAKSAKIRTGHGGFLFVWHTHQMGFVIMTNHFCKRQSKVAKECYMGCLAKKTMDMSSNANSNTKWAPK